MISDFWEYLKDHDAPNWFVFFFSLIVWPPIVWAIAYWWTTRKRQSVPGFLVTPTPGQITIGSKPYDAVILTFINQTGSVVYLSRAKLKAVRRNFHIPIAASRDLAFGWHELVFALASAPDSFNNYECVLQTDVTNGRVMAAIAVMKSPQDTFYSYRPGLLRRLFRWPRYFQIEYVVVVADKKFSVAMVY
jgi:hypothetical protein